MGSSSRARFRINDPYKHKPFDVLPDDIHPVRDELTDVPADKSMN